MIAMPGRALLFAFLLLPIALAAEVESVEGKQKHNCAGGQVWKECGQKCVKTCTEPAPECSKECQAKCECPDTEPIWNDMLQMCGTMELCEAKVCSHTTCHFDANNLMKVNHHGKEEHGISTRCMEHDGDCVCYCTKEKLVSKDEL